MPHLRGMRNQWSCFSLIERFCFGPIGNFEKLCPVASCEIARQNSSRWVYRIACVTAFVRSMMKEGNYAFT